MHSKGENQDQKSIDATESNQALDRMFCRIFGRKTGGWRTKSAPY